MNEILIIFVFEITYIPGNFRRTLIKKWEFIYNWYTKVIFILPVRKIQKFVADADYYVGWYFIFLLGSRLHNFT